MTRYSINHWLGMRHFAGMDMATHCHRATFPLSESKPHCKQCINNAMRQNPFTLMAAPGVSVVGATSRPDLLDAALLRPGRLDRLLLCDFPDAGARVAIVRALARRMPLAPDAQLDAMAAGADGFTGGATLLQPSLQCCGVERSFCQRISALV